jgi:hypothetical protein
MSSLSEQMKALRDRLAKDSHKSHLPSSSDRFVRKPKSLCHKSEKKSGGQPGHPGASLPFSSTPDETIELPVKVCEACQQDLHAVAACGRERREARGSAVASCGGAGISSRAETVSPLPADHHRGISSRRTGSHPIWTRVWDRLLCTWSNSNCCPWPVPVR